MDLRLRDGHLTGPQLRYALIVLLVEARREVTTSELVAGLDANGFRVRGRPSKAVSDALRWEVRRGRVRRCGRGVYAAGAMSRATAWRMTQRVRTLRAQVVAQT